LDDDQPDILEMDVMPYCKDHGHLSPTDECPNCAKLEADKIERDTCPHCKEPYQYGTEKYRRRHREKQCLKNPDSTAAREERYEAKANREHELEQMNKAAFVNLIEVLIEAKVDAAIRTDLQDAAKGTAVEIAKESLFYYIDQHVELK
jgi:hypothetical protein